ncbi:TPA: hypothetical protein MH443_14755 [Klebsiella pneumoniae]|nr:hypothetical protein [Klebsiella pneumoniae]
MPIVILFGGFKRSIYIALILNKELSARGVNIMTKETCFYIGESRFYNWNKVAFIEPFYFTSKSKMLLMSCINFPVIIIAFVIFIKNK